MNYTFLEWILISLLIATGLLVALVLIREVVRASLRVRLQRRSRACRQLIESYQKKQFQDINKLLFYLKDTYETEVVEHVLREFVAQEDTHFRENLRDIYGFLQITQQYIADLESVRWRTRAEAAFMLGQIGDPIAVPHLLARMKDPDEDEQNVKMSCAQALGLIRDTEAIPHLIKALEDVNQWSSVKVAELLVWFGQKAIPFLQQALQEESGVNQRMWVAQILGAIGDSSTVPILTQRLRDRDSNVRIASVEALGRLKSPLAVHSIIDLLLRDPVAEVRAQAALALGQIADSRALKPLVNALNDPEYWTRVRAVEALEVLGGEHIPELERLIFFDPREEVRRRAAQALERLGIIEQRKDLLLREGEPEAQDTYRLFVTMAQLGSAQQLQGYLHDKNIKFRYRICEILGEANNPALEPALVEASKDEVWSIRIKAMGYLAKNQSLAALTSLKEALAQADVVQRPPVVETLKQLSYLQLEEFVPQLLRLCNDENIETRMHAIELLAQFPSLETQSALTPCLRDPVADVRMAAINSLRQHNDPSLTPYITALLDDPERAIRLKVCSVLGGLNDPRAIESLIQAFEGADTESRRIIANSLAQFGFDAFYERLDELMGLDSLDVKIGVCWALGQTRDPRSVRILSFFKSDHHISLRAAAIGSLGRIPDRSASQAVLSALRDVNKQVRTSAVNALLRIGIPEGLDLVADLFSDPDEFLRCRTALALGWLDQDGRYESKMCTLFDLEKEEQTRYHILLGIGLIPTNSAFRFVLPHFHQASIRRPLLELLEKEEPKVKKRFLANLNLEHLESIQDDTSDALIERYTQDVQQNQNPKQREIAIDALGILSNTKSVPYLLEALHSDPEERLRQKAATALGQIGEQWPKMHKQIEQGLLQATSDPVPSVSEAALKALLFVGSSSIGSELYGLLRSTVESIRAAAREVLLHIYKNDPMGLLELLEKTDDIQLNTAGIRLLGKVDDPLILDYLIRMLQASDRALRVSAVRTLKEHIHHPHVVEALHRSRKDPSPEVRTWCIRILSQVDDPSMIEKLLPHAKEPAESVRIALLSALEQSNTAIALQTIEHLAVDPKESVKQRALVALLTQGSPRAVQIFLKLLDTMDRATRRKTQEYIEQHKQGALLLQRSKMDLDPERRRAALLLIEKLYPQQHKVCIEALDDPAPEVRREAARILVPHLQKDTPELRYALQRLRQDPDYGIQHLIQKYFVLTPTPGFDF